VTVNLTTFEELLMTKTMMQKNNKSGWVDPSCNWGQREAKTRLKMQVNSRKQGEKGNGLPPEGSVTISFSVLSSLEKMGVPGSGKPTAMNRCEATIKRNRRLICEVNS